MVKQGDSNIKCGKTSENTYEEFINEASKSAERTTMEGRIIEKHCWRGVFRRGIAIKKKMQRSKTDEKMQQKKENLLKEDRGRKKKKRLRRKNKWRSKVTAISEMKKKLQ